MEYVSILSKIIRRPNRRRAGAVWQGAADSQLAATTTAEPGTGRSRSAVGVPGSLGAGSPGAGRGARLTTLGNLKGKLSFPAGILNFESSCGVCDSWGWARVGRGDCGGRAMMDACGAGRVMGALRAGSAGRGGGRG